MPREKPQRKVLEAKASRRSREAPGRKVEEAKALRNPRGSQEAQWKPQGKVVEAKASKRPRGSLREKFRKPRLPGCIEEASWNGFGS